MDRKKSKKESAGPDETLQEFEEVDLTATAAPEAAAEFTAESLGGLGDANDHRALMQAQAELEQRLLVPPEAAMAAMAEDGTSGRGNIVGVGIGEKEVDGY